jgi:flagellar hook assembly protein FlgD
MSNARMAAETASIEQNSPNPFTNSTQIRFELKQAENVQLNVFDLNGKNIYQYAQHFNAGKHALFWDGFDRENKKLPKGIYIYKITGESFEDTKRLMIER